MPTNEVREEIVTFFARDGFQIDALFLSPGEGEGVISRPVLLQIHGVLGNFLARGTPRLIPPAVLSFGISSLSINTRMAFVGQIMGYGIFDDALMDLDAAIGFLKERGFRNIFLLGYSLGANLAAYYLSTRGSQDVKGLILEGCSFSLPDSQRNRYTKWGSIPSYDDIYETAKKVLGGNPYRSSNDQIFVVYRAWGPSFMPLDTELFTYKTWWFMRSPEAEGAKTYKLIGKVDVPILFIHGEEDYIVEEWEPRVLLRIARRSGNRHVTLRFIPGAGHDCMENPDLTIGTIVEWITGFGVKEAKPIKEG
jgi:pimeloyl-ACP methyl ester carboxylesterase